MKDKTVNGLIGRFMRAGTADGGRIERTTKGIPQGGCISPFLCNVALTGLDEELSPGGARKWPPPFPMLTSAPLHYERYADDFNVLVEGEKNAEAIKNFIAELLEKKLKMTLSTAKTHITELHDGFDFLGHRVWKETTAGTTTCRLAPSNTKLHELLEDLKSIAIEENQPEDRRRRVDERVLGFVKYYFLITEPEKQAYYTVIENTLERLGLRPDESPTDSSNTMTQKIAS